MRAQWGQVSPVVKGQYSRYEPVSGEGKFSLMKTSFRDAFFAALDKSGRSLREVAIAADVSYEQLKKFKQGKSEKTNAEDAAALAAVLGYTIESLIGLNGNSSQKAIAVAGRVGAGAKVELVDAYAKGDGLYRVAIPDGLSPRGLVAVEVEGDSMAPIYQPGTVLFYSREAVGVPSEAVGRICVCEDQSGQAWVKVVRVGREEGTFSLISLNPEAENMHGLRLTWAAPVKFNLPPEYVQRVE